MNGEVVVLFPAHPSDCPVCEGDGCMRWCPVRPAADGRMVARRLGTPTPCIPLPVWDPVPPVDPSDGAA